MQERGAREEEGEMEKEKGRENEVDRVEIGTLENARERRQQERERRGSFYLIGVCMR